MSSIRPFGLTALLLATLAAPTSADDEGVPDWENPAVFGRQKTPAHATLTPWPDEVGALTFTPALSPWRRVLGGDWRFHFLPGRDGAPADFESASRPATARGA